MSDETHTKEELSEMNRLHLRRICKKNGMSSTDCAQMDFEDMVAWILEQQGDEGEKPAKAKGGKGGKAKGGKAAGAKGGKAAGAKAGKAAPAGGRKPPARSKAAKKDKDEDEGDTEISIDLGELEGKIDTIGTMLDENFNAMDENVKGLTELVNNLSVEVYQIKHLVLHLGAWAENDDILTPDNAPDGFGFQEKLAELEAECQGEDEGGDE